MHYQRLKRTGTTDLTGGRHQNHNLCCKVLKCTAPARTRGLCSAHYKYVWRESRELGISMDDMVKNLRLVKKAKSLRELGSAPSSSSTTSQSDRIRSTASARAKRDAHRNQDQPQAE